ncbi:MFS transporter [Leucobacter sp. BZR 635]
MLAPLGHDATAIVVGVLFIGLFLLAEARGRHTVLPRMTFERGNPLKWVYLLLATLCAGVMIETYVPLFGQQLGGLSPVWAGFLGAALSLGWTASQIVSVRFGPKTSRAVMVVSPILLAAALAAYGILQHEDAGAGRIVLWIVALALAGTAIGAAFPHLSVRAMGATEEQAEGEKAAAALSTTQLIAYALVSALLGVFSTSGSGDPAGMAQGVAFGIAAITGVGLLPGLMLLVSSRRSAAVSASSTLPES